MSMKIAMLGVSELGILVAQAGFAMLINIAPWTTVVAEHTFAIVSPLTPLTLGGIGDRKHRIQAHLLP